MPSSALQTIIPSANTSTLLEPTPHTTEQAEHLASANSESPSLWSNFFEGAEKRLVIYFAAESTDSKEKSLSTDADLRLVPRSIWESVLDLVNCRILSVMSNEHVDAYLLSESSMFVTKNRVLVKTCGSTTLLHCLEQMLTIGLKHAGFGRVEDCFYSHKNLLVPEAQPHPHQCFGKECDYLDKVSVGVYSLEQKVQSDLEESLKPGNLDLEMPI